MLLLVSGTTKTVGRLAGEHPNALGHLLTPKGWNGIESILATGLSWAVDNGAFSGFDPVAFRRLLSRASNQPRLLWIVCPDVVGDAAGTCRRFDEWAEEVREAGPVAFVGQDGQEAIETPWSRFDCFFVGGSTEWKMSSAAWDMAQEARRRGKWLHVGRVNSLRRLRHCWTMQADSIDGSSLSMFGETHIPKFLKWASQQLAWPTRSTR